MVELPELNENQRIYLLTIYHFFHNEGKWPTFLEVENTIRKTNPEIWTNFDLAEVCKSLPDNFATGFSFNHQYGQEAAFIAPVLYYFPQAKEEIDDFIRVLGFCIEKINTSDEERPAITSNDLESQLHRQPLAIRKMGLLFTSEGDIADGSGYNDEWWQINLKRGKNGARRFEGVETFEQYLERRTGLTRYFSGKVTTQPRQNGEGNEGASDARESLVMSQSQTPWHTSLTAQLNEFLMHWKFVYVKKVEKLINPSLSQMQTKFIDISERLITILAQNSQGIPAKIANEIGSVAASLDDLGRMQFFIDGGLSVGKFNTLGDSIVEVAEDILEELNDKAQPASVFNKAALFEKFVHDLLEKSGYRLEPEQRKQNRRVDLVAYVPVTSPDGTKRQQMWVVEVKYRNLQKQIDVEVLHQLLAYAEIFNAAKALLVTISTLTTAAKEFLARRRELEVWDAYKLLALVKQFPEMKQDYPDIALQLENAAKVENLADRSRSEQHELIKELRALPTGDGKAYEELVQRILAFCFKDEFSPFAIKEQVYTYNKKRIRDFIIDNRSPKVEFWQSLKYVRKVEKILFDAKNYKDLVEYRDILVTLRYLKNEAFGNFIIIISRQGLKDYEEVVEDFSDNGQIALFLSDDDLVKMITLKLKGESPTLLIEDGYYDFLDKK
ncbi:MAG TPA: restriction endonuclease [Ktedonobacteraceae bacterium]|nr:restriction endonuclease [Ktedonobacteraceae bacterium]